MASNPPSANSPAGPKVAKAARASAASQAEEDPNQTLQTEEGPSSPSQREPRSSAPETVQGIIIKSRKGKGKEPHLFSHAPHLKLAHTYEEMLLESITHCHHPWNPNEDRDPLAEFSAEEGALPGISLSQTMLFQDTSGCHVYHITVATASRAVCISP